MEKVRPWCGQPSDRGRLKNRAEHVYCGVRSGLVLRPVERPPAGGVRIARRDNPAVACARRNGGCCCRRRRRGRVPGRVERRPAHGGGAGGPAGRPQAADAASDDAGSQQDHD